jgi:hypothetical protein
VTDPGTDPAATDLARTDPATIEPVRPRPVSAADRAAFQELLDGALPAVRAMAAAWRTGLAGLVTLLTTGIVLTGRTATANLTTGWRAAVTVTIGGGLTLVIVGLWHALAAEVGSRARLQSLEQIRAHHASVQAYQVGLAAAAADRLQDARRLVAIALALLLTGVLLTWWAPAAPADPPAYLKITRTGGSVCGVLASADNGSIRLTAPGAHDPLVIPMATVTSMTVTAACP